MSAPSLDDFASALASTTEARLRAQPPRPDLADVLARARAIDEAAIVAGLAATLDVDVDTSSDEDERPDPGLAAFAAAMRVSVERGVRERELAPVPSPRRPMRRRTLAAGAVLAAAAAVLLAWGWSRVAPTVLDPSDARDPMGAAGAAVDSEDDARAYEDARPRPAPAPDPDPEPVSDPIDEPPASAEGLEPEPEPSTAPRAKPSGPSLDELEARAREAWAAGELKTAEALFRRIVRRAGNSNRAELAYGDLFAIARQRGGQSALADAWRAYLRRFPRGRYADDARAGLCRRATDEAAPACWDDYLKAHPHGTHAAEARRLRSASQSP